MIEPALLILAIALALCVGRISGRQVGYREGYMQGFGEGKSLGVLEGIQAVAELKRRQREKEEQPSTGMPPIETQEQAQQLSDAIDRGRGRGEWN